MNSDKMYKYLNVPFNEIRKKITQQTANMTEKWKFISGLFYFYIPNLK